MGVSEDLREPPKNPLVYLNLGIPNLPHLKYQWEPLQKKNIQWEPPNLGLSPSSQLKNCHDLGGSHFRGVEGSGNTFWWFKARK